MYRLILRGLSICVFVLCCSQPASAWSLKTHSWTADQVIADVLDDGAVTIAGKAYAVPAEVLNAIRNHPDVYRMGHIGPDAFPDPLVGQTTTHPGVDGGWQTGDWLRHLLSNAQTSPDVALAYGFAGHAAGDIFAHTYVNMYAGDIFSLTDGESEVELRHFVLEKFIEAHTPTNWTNQFSVPSDFLRDRLIFDTAVSDQYARAGTGGHLVAMNASRKIVREFSKGMQTVIDKLIDFKSDKLKKAADISVDLATAKLAFEAAEKTHKAAQGVFDLRNKVYQEALRTLRRGIEILEKNPGLISLQERIVAEQLGIIADAARAIGQLNNQLGGLIGSLNDLQARLRDIPRVIFDAVCVNACNLIPISKYRKKCREGCRKVNDAWNDVNNQINNLHRKINQIRTDIGNWTAREVEAVARKGEALARKVALEKELIVTKGLIESYKAAVKVAELERKAAQEVLDGTGKVLAEARRLRDELAGELKKVNDIIDVAAKHLKDLNPITLFFDNWQKDIAKASSAYIDASRTASLRMLHNEGGALKAYTDWYGCWGAVYTGVPGIITNPLCEAKNRISELKGKLTDFIDSLPEVLRWLINPAGEVRKRAEEELRPELEKLGFKIVSFLTDRRTAEFLELLSKPENATRDKLNDVYRSDDSGKSLLTFQQVSDQVLADMQPVGGAFDPTAFIPIRNAVVLSKLSLLSPLQLSAVFRDHAGNVPTMYGPELYGTGTGRYTLIVDMVRNIDGNHQWQAYGLPFPRRGGGASPGPSNLPFGYDYFLDNTKGFRYWVDPIAREKVFSVLFPPPGPLGKLGERTELEFPAYAFEACERNPFPQTQNAQGAVLFSDTRCLSPWNPIRWVMLVLEHGDP